MGFGDTFKALSNPLRREILMMLRDSGKLAAGEIAARFHQTAPTISHHLNVLKQAELVFETREKNYIYYQLNLSVLEEVLLWMEDLKGEKRHEEP